jgi:hypothetical protein
MADEELLPETPAVPEAPSTAEQERVETPELETEQVEGEEGQSEDEEDFEAEDGSKYRVPKSLVPYLMRNKDYTQKRQADAETSRALAARQAEIEERAKATDEELDARAELKIVSKELDRLKGYDFAAYQAHRQTDPMAAEEVWNYLQHMRNQKAELDAKIGTVQQQRTAKAEQELATRVQETVAWAQKEIPNWKPDLTNTLVKFAQDSGVPEASLKSNWSPVFYKLLHRAYLGEQLLKKQSAPKPAPTTPPEPLRIVKGKSAPSSTALSDDLPIDEWNRRREAQIKRKQRA